MVEVQYTRKPLKTVNPKPAPLKQEKEKLKKEKEKLKKEKEQITKILHAIISEHNCFLIDKKIRYWTRKYDHISEKHGEDLGKWIKENRDNLPPDDWGEKVSCMKGVWERRKKQADKFKALYLELTGKEYSIYDFRSDK